MFERQPVEQDDFVEPIEKFRTEMPAHDFHHLRLHHFDILIVAQGRNELRAKIGGQNDNSIGEINCPALTIGQATIVQHLQQNVENVGMGLFDFVKQHDLVGAPPHRLGQNAAFFIPDIAGGCPDQPGDGMFFHEFRHIDPDHRGGIVEHEGGKRLGQLGLADAGWPQEQEGTERAIGVLQPSPGAADGGRHRVDRISLPDDLFAKLRFHRQQLFALPFQHPIDRNAGPSRHDAGDVFRHDLFAQHGGGGRRLRLGKFALKRRNDAIAQLAGPGEIAAALGLVHLDARRIKPFLEPGCAVQFFLFPLPAGRQHGSLFLKYCKIIFQR